MSSSGGSSSSRTCMLRSAPAAYFATWAAPCAASSESRATALRRTACSAHLCGGQARATVRAKARTGVVAGSVIGEGW